MRWSLVATIADRGCTVIALILLARLIGVGHFGIWALAATTAGLVAAISTLGMHIDAQRSISPATITPEARRRVLTVTLTTLIVGLLFASPAGWVTSLFEVAAKVPTQHWIAAVVIVGTSRGLNQLAHRLLIARERIAFAFMFHDGLRNSLTVIGVLCLGADLTNLLMVYSIASLLVMVLAWSAIVCLERPVLIGPRTNLSLWQLIRSGSGVLTVSTVFFLRRQGDVLLLGALLSDEHYGAYFAAARLANIAAMAMAALSNPLGPRIGAAFASGQKLQAQQAITLVTSRSTVLATLALATLAVVGEPLLMLFGSQFTMAWPVLLLLSAGMVAQAALGPTGMVLQFCGRAWTCAIIEGLSAGAGLTLLWIAASHWGIIAAAGVAAGTMASCAALEAAAVKKSTGLSSTLNLLGRH
ncbi:MAG: lipopolysaccharide biosynthesis protein [Phycisphaerales bacterium]|nr:lipopolysaccharide biosynthesis protein [Phycisphaerales bacterium]